MEDTSQITSTNISQEPDVQVEPDVTSLVPDIVPETLPNVIPFIKTKFRLTLEPILLMLFLGFNVSSLVQTNLFEERTCLHYEFAQNKSVDCSNMTSSELEQIQPSVADLKMFKNLIEILVPSVTMLFLGSWSDVNGRLPLFLAVISGMLVTNCMYCIFSLIPELPPITYLLCSVPVAITGGNGTLLVVSFCYIVDITDNKSRAFRISILQTFISLGSIIGSILSSPLYSKSLTYPLVLSSMVTLGGLFYTINFLEETIIIREETNKKLFNLIHIKDTWKSIVKKRCGFLRCIIMISAVSLALNITILTGEDLVMYMYLQKQFSWSLQDYTLFDAYSTLLNGIIPVGSLYILSTKTDIPDMYLAIASSGLRIVEKIGLAFSVYKWHFYVIKIVGCVVMASEALVRSQLSQSFPTEDFSKIYTFVSVIEGFGGFVGSPLYTTVYDLTIHNFSNSTFFLSSLIGAFGVILLLIMTYLLKKSLLVYNPLMNEPVTC